MDKSESFETATFVDIGAGNGETLKQYLSNQGASVARAYLWEPRLNLEPGQKERASREVIDGVETYWLHDAAWGCTCNRWFYPGTSQRGEGSSLYSDKNTGGIDYERRVKVQCSDIGRWTEQFIPPGYGILKLNCEGAEYNIIRRLYVYRVLRHYRLIYLTRHSRKIESLGPADDVLANSRLFGDGFVCCRGSALGGEFETWVQMRYKHPTTPVLPNQVEYDCRP